MSMLGGREVETMESNALNTTAEASPGEHRTDGDANDSLPRTKKPRRQTSLATKRSRLDHWQRHTMLLAFEVTHA